MFQMLVDLIFWLITSLADLIFSPIIAFLENVFPDLTTLISNVEYFLSTWVFPTLQWVKMVLINTLAFPPQLLSFLIATFSVLVTIYLTMLTYKCIVTLYQKLKP